MPQRRGIALFLPLLSLACAPTGGDPDAGQPDAGLDGPLLHVASPEWQEQIIYFVMIDRFANGDPTNDDQGADEFDPTKPSHFNGGDLAGLKSKLDYVQGLGATAVWITPPVANMWWDPLQEYGGYHGYWARDLKKVDEHFGTLDDYKKLSDALHRRGMYLVQDIVPNHMGNFFAYSGDFDPQDPTKNVIRNTAATPGSAPEQSPFDQNDVTNPAHRAANIYHWTPAIADYTDPDQEANWQISDLDDLNTENPVVRTALRDSYGYWIREVGVDGFRLDTAKFIPPDFWRDFFHSTDTAMPGIMSQAKATGRESFHAFGEIFETSTPFGDEGESKMLRYTSKAGDPIVPAQLHFPLYEEIGRVFGEGRATAFMGDRLTKFMDPALVPDPFRTPTFIDNHDVRRFLTVGSREAFRQALVFLFTIPGIPVVYYGTEQAFTETRPAMFAGGYLADTDKYDTEAIHYKRLAKLAGIRKSSKLWTRGALSVVYDNPAGSGPLAYKRTWEDEEGLVLMNTSDETVLFSGIDTGLPAGTVLELLHVEKAPEPAKIGPNGKLVQVMPPRGVLVFKATPETQDPGTPAATITLSTLVEGQTFTGDVTLSGTVTPANTALKLVLDGCLDRAADVTVEANGSFNVVLPVSLFPVGREAHALSIWAPVAKVSSPRYRFTTDVAFEGDVLGFDDPAGDDTGPAGTYTYPLDDTFRNQMDIEKVTLEVGATTLNVKVTMFDWTTVWNPPNAFDHVVFSVFLDVPGREGLTFLPTLQATAPEGFAWDFQHFVSGWKNTLTGTEGATATTAGTPLAGTPSMRAQAGTKTLVLTYDRNAFGLESWVGTKLYVTTWDYDGIENAFRPLVPVAEQWKFGGGASTDPLVMDVVGPVEIVATE